MTTGDPVLITTADPYAVPAAVNESTTPGLFETTIVTSALQLDIGGGVLADLEVYNGAAPGPTLFLDKDDIVVVRQINQLPHPSGIHWHGIELPNGADGTPVTQNGLPGAVVQTLGDGTPAGGTYLYKFTVPRPGLYWYHPHHFHSTNRVFRQTFGMIVVADPAEASLISSGILPDAAHTYQLALSDITVCKAPGDNDDETYPSTMPWAGPDPTVPIQGGPTPAIMCEFQPVDEHGDPILDGMGNPIPLAAGEVPNLQRAGRVNEGQTVLTNGVYVGGRAGTPEMPGDLDMGAHELPVAPGDGIRLQIVNTATTRYFRLQLKVQDGPDVVTVPLIRIGGEGGLLDFARVEGDPVGMPGFFKYEEGEIVLPPASRADVVAVVPPGASGKATLWTLDYQRTGSGADQNWSHIPSVPVMHLDIAGTPAAYSLSTTAPILNAVGAVAPSLPDPMPGAGFLPVPAGKLGMPDLEIRLQAAGSPMIDGEPGNFSMPPIYTQVAHRNSTRYAAPDDLILLTVINETSAHHPFHLHGFSFQPVALNHPADPDFSFDYNEFRDNVDIPPGYTLTARVHFDNRPWHDGVTMGGNFGRWLFHCHIFHHAHKGMIAELVVTSPDGFEKPNVNVHGSWVYAAIPGVARRTGKFSHPDGLPITSLQAHLADGTPIGSMMQSGDDWSWEYNTAGASPFTDYVYVTASDGTRTSQAVFRLQVGGDANSAWDNGDPHIHALDGTRYDFQAAGEFTLLIDDHGMEVQARQTPVPIQNPIDNDYAGLKVCVAVNTAVAARVGGTWISYQAGREPGTLEFFINGKRAGLPQGPVQIETHLVSTFDADGEIGLRVDWAHGPVLQVTPKFWTGHNVHYMNVAISDATGRGGLMAPIAHGSWLPPLPGGQALGPRPSSSDGRYHHLYRVFGEAWRVTGETSLFHYAPGTSADSFTDRDWPGEDLPCNVKPGLGIPGMTPLAGMDVAQAKHICSFLADDGLRQDCVFDVTATGDESFADAYRFADVLKRKSTGIVVAAEEEDHGAGKVTVLIGLVRLLNGGVPTGGTVSFWAGETELSPDIPLASDGTARWEVDAEITGPNDITAVYTGGGDSDDTTSPPARVDITPKPKGQPPRAGSLPWWVWILLLLLVVIVILWLYR